MRKYMMLMFGILLVGCTQDDWRTVGAIMTASSKQKPVETVSSDAIFGNNTTTNERVRYKRTGNMIYGSDGSVCTIKGDNIYCNYH